MTFHPDFNPSRRGFLGLGLGGHVLAAALQPAAATKLATKARIVIIGAGVAGKRQP